MWIESNIDNKSITKLNTIILSHIVNSLNIIELHVCVQEVKHAYN